MTLSDEEFSFLSHVQEATERVVKGVGGLTHKEYRTFNNGKRVSEQWFVLILYSFLCFIPLIVNHLFLYF